jgi:tetratricopeptide (TPR) repeat protein
VGWLWYLVTLLPVIGLVQVGSQARADRFTYLPQIGLAIAVAWGARAALARWRHATPALVAASLAVGATYLALTARQVHVWRDSETLFRHSLAVTGDNSLAHTLLGAALAGQGRFAEAETHHAEAVRLNPRNAGAHANLGNAFLRKANPDEAERHYRDALRLEPDLPEAHNGLGVLLARQGETEAAIEHYQRALGLRAHYAEARLNLANALRTQERYAEAAAAYRAVIERRPEWAEGHYGLAVCLASGGDVDEAEREFREALHRDPRFAEAHYGLGLALEDRGATAEAIAELRAAVELRPDWPTAAAALAWLLATAPEPALRNPAEAIALAEAARAAGGESPQLFETLAVAHAAAGRFVEAAAAARQATILARAAGDERLAADLEERARSYETRTPSGTRAD